ncbi:MAG: peptidoglycan DD-metalloendopeptidase family protein [Pseudomonadota bacterium]
MVSGVAFLSDALFTAILHSLWQGSVFALVFAGVAPRMTSSVSRYRLALVLFSAAPIAFIATFLNAIPAASAPTLAAAAVQQTPLAFYIALTWCIGATLVGARYFCGWLWLRLVIVRCSVAVPPSIEALFEDTRRALTVPRKIRLRASASIHSPMVTGVFQPVVLLPITMLSGVPSSVLTAVFTHELLHVRRLDHIAVFAQAVGDTLLFYHPAVRWLSAECRRHREYRCDDESIDALGDRIGYARALLAIEESAADLRVPALLMNGEGLMNRVERILGDDRPAEQSRSYFSGVFALAMIGVLAYSLGFSEDADAEGHTREAGRYALSIDWLPPAVSRYSDVIESAAQRHDVPANVLALMLLVESNGDAQAESSSGARGLMQVMPKTGLAIAKERGIRDFDIGELFEPETNIDFGAWYLAQMMARFSDHQDRNEELAISAYNAGPGSVSAYLEGAKPLPPETAGYRDLLLSMLSEADKHQSLVLEGRKEEFRRRLPAFQVPVVGRVSSQFGHDAGDKGIHRGVDIAAPMGSAVVAPAGGEVTSVGEDERRGKYITVRHLYGVESRYFHLSDITVSVGEDIQAGDPLGAVGSTGRSTGPHLHFEVRELGEAVSPSLYGLVLE